MSLIFVGSVVDRETLKKMPDASVAGNKMELGFIKGFIENGVRTYVLSVESNGMWKFNRKPVIIKKKHLKDETAEIETVPYINIPVIKQLLIMHNLKHSLKKVLKKEEFKDSVLLVYNTMTFFAYPVLSVSKKKKLPSMGIIADLPDMASTNLIRKLENKKEQNIIKDFSGLIPLTEHIAHDFAPGVPYCVVEAGCRPEDYDEEARTLNKSEKKQIVFSGTLNEFSGIELIIEAMSYIKNKDISLYIYGDGPQKPFVINAAEKADNIYYCGRVTNDKMLKIQQNCDLLVCPRRSDNFVTKYTFPSKVLEYICAGVPVLSNRLKGIPEEYEEYINYAESESAPDWAEAIQKILNGEKAGQYREKALSAREKVLQNKSWKNQTAKVLRHFKSEGFNIK